MGRLGMVRLDVEGLLGTRKRFVVVLTAVPEYPRWVSNVLGGPANAGASRAQPHLVVFQAQDFTLRAAVEPVSLGVLERASAVPAAPA